MMPAVPLSRQDRMNAHLWHALMASPRLLMLQRLIQLPWQPVAFVDDSTSG